MQLDEFKEKPHDLNELLALIIENASKYTHAERTIIYLYDEGEQVLWNRAGEGVEFMSIEMKFGQGIPGQVIEKMKSINIPDVSKSTLYDPKIDDVSDVAIHSMLCSPITDRDHKRIGVIQLINKRDGIFDDKDVAFVEAMCSQAAIGISNTLMFVSLQALRKRELELTEKIKEQNELLQVQYQKVDEEKKEIQQSSKAIGKAWLYTSLFVILALAGIGYYFWQSGTIGSLAATKLAEKEKPVILKPGAEEDKNVFVVKTQSLTSPLSLSGSLEPSEVENIFAPFTGRIVSKNFTIGEAVKKDQVLLVLNTEKIEAQYRNAEKNELKAKEEYDKKKNWSTSKELANARREVLKAQENLNTTERLYKLGIESQQNFENAQEQVDKARDSLSDIEKQGNEQNVLFAEYDWKNAALDARELKDKMSKATIKSNVDGIAITPLIFASGDKKVPTIEPGVTLDESTVFVTVADLTHLKVLGRVREVNITSVKPGQDVKIFGEAFPGTILTGKVTYVSSQAKTGREPYFDIYVVTDPLTEEQRKRIRLGMTATLKVDTYTNPKAILVPFDTVKLTREGVFVYKVKPGSTEPEKIPVTTGLTTQTAVEITSGLKEGDRIVNLTQAQTQ